MMSRAVASNVCCLVVINGAEHAVIGSALPSVQLPWVPYIESSDTPVRVILKPFTAEDLYHVARDAITRAPDLSALAETEIVRAHAGLSKLALALEESRTMRVQTVDLVIAARELRRAAGG